MCVSPVGKDWACSILLVATLSLPPALGSRPVGPEHFPFPPQNHYDHKSALTKPGSKLEAPYESMGMFGTHLELVI